MLNVLGQPRAIRQLQRSLRSGRMASTWIFAGPVGVGKFKTAVETAKVLLCDRPTEQANGARVPGLPPDFPLRLACGACDSCRAIEAGNHPDLHVIAKELIRFHDRTGKSKGTTLSIAVIRGEITGNPDPDNPTEAKIYKRSFRGRGKVFIIDEADLMEAPAQNALLKTLEEPPAESYLIMITSSPQELLSTIRSRSQLVEFAPLPEEVVLQGLIAEGLPHGDAQLLARLAQGSLGRALRWARDLRVIDEKNAGTLARKGQGDAEDGDESPAANLKFTPGGILAWTRQLAEALDRLVQGQGGASDVAAVILKFAGEYAALELVRDPLTSEAEAKRRGIALLMGVAAEWFTDRLRHGLGTPYPTPLPALSGGLDYGTVPELIASARAAEAQIDMNANEKILVAATTTRWEKLLRSQS